MQVPQQLCDVVACTRRATDTGAEAADKSCEAPCCVQLVDHSRHVVQLSGYANLRATDSICLVSGPEQDTASGGYRLPPKEILDIIDAPVQPSLSYSPDRKQVHGVSQSVLVVPWMSKHQDDGSICEKLAPLNC